MRKILSVLGLVVAVVLVFSTCKHEPRLIFSDNSNTDWGTEPDDTTICFERDILPIFVTNCAKSGCHNDSAHAEGLRLFTYDGIMFDDKIKPGNPDGSETYRQLSTGKMSWPEYGNLDSAQKELIRRWILDSARNTTNCPSKCDTTVFTFSGAIDPIIQKSCIGCHNDKTTDGGINLNGYQNAADAVNSGKLISSLKRSTGYMPKGGLPRLSDCKIRQFEKWKQDGTPNN